MGDRWVLRALSLESLLNLTCVSTPVSSALLQLTEGMEDPFLPLGSRKEWRLWSRGRCLCQLYPMPPAHTHTHTHTRLHLKLGLGTEDGKGEPGPQETWE